MMYEIRVFDDGNKQFEKYTNRWLLMGTRRGKVTLKNIEDREVVVIISFWKIIAIKTQVCL
jgi:hypothetical protein